MTKNLCISIIILVNLLRGFKTEIYFVASLDRMFYIHRPQVHLKRFNRNVPYINVSNSFYPGDAIMWTLWTNNYIYIKLLNTSLTSTAVWLYHLWSKGTDEWAYPEESVVSSIPCLNLNQYFFANTHTTGIWIFRWHSCNLCCTNEKWISIWKLLLHFERSVFHKQTWKSTIISYGVEVFHISLT